MPSSNIDADKFDRSARSKKGTYGHTGSADRFRDKASQAVGSPACRAAPLITTYSAQGAMFKSNRTEPLGWPRFRAILACLGCLPLEQARHFERTIAINRSSNRSYTQHLSYE